MAALLDICGRGEIFDRQKLPFAGSGCRLRVIGPVVRAAAFAAARCRQCNEASGERQIMQLAPTPDIVGCGFRLSGLAFDRVYVAGQIGVGGQRRLQTGAVAAQPISPPTSPAAIRAVKELRSRWWNETGMEFSGASAGGWGGYPPLARSLGGNN